MSKSIRTNKKLNSKRPSRRRAIATGAAVGSSLIAYASTEPDVVHAAEGEQPLNRFPRMVQEWFVEQVRLAERRHLQRLNALKTKQDAENYVLKTRERIRLSFGENPEKTQLNARITRTTERSGYRIEHLIFESRPGFPVTANLYIPNGDGPFPGVVGTCGHSDVGKAAEAYQSFAQGLVKLGYVCLLYDPIGQGERLQYVSDNLKSTVGVGVMEHLHGGNQQYLVGEFFGAWRAWDGIRALDYLRSRPEVDSERVGVTGNSGGGTMTTWLSGVETRWSMSAPSCFISTFRRNLENELPQDTEQCPPKSLALGLDHADFLAAMAPEPVIILAKERDFFDVRGAEETYDRLKRLYGLIGAEKNIAIFTGPTGHGYSIENREAMYSWFHYATGLKNSHVRDVGDAIEVPSRRSWEGDFVSDASVTFVPEPNISIESEDALWCTEKGQVATLPGVKTVFDFTREKSQSLAKQRDSVSGDALRKAVVDVLKLPLVPDDAPEYRNWHYLNARGYPSKYAMAYAVESEPGIHSIVYRMTEERWSSRPPKSDSIAVLYVAHHSSDRELREELWLHERFKPNSDTALYTCDVRGVGESQPDTCGQGSFLKPYGSDYFYAVHSLMLDRPYLGQKTFDVLRVVQWLKSLGHADVHLVGKGWGALAATFAGILSKDVTKVTLKNALTSYAEVAESEDYKWPLSTLLPGVLERFDLPDCYRELKSKKDLKLIEPWNAMADKT